MTILVEPTEVTIYEKEQKNYDPHLATLVRAIFLDLKLESLSFVI